MRFCLFFISFFWLFLWLSASLPSAAETRSVAPEAKPRVVGRVVSSGSAPTGPAPAIPQAFDDDPAATTTLAPHAPTVTPTPSSAAVASPPTQVLNGINLHPLAHGLRLVLSPDRLVPYTVRSDPKNLRVEVDLINTRIDYFPPELAKLNDPRLAGIGLKQGQPGLVTLELRLTNPWVKIDHFALDEPAAIVLDLTHENSQGSSIATTPASRTALTTSSQPAVPKASPSSLVSTTTQQSLKTLDDRASQTLTQPVAGPALPENWLGTQSAVPAEPPPVTLPEVGETSPPLKAASAIAPPGGESPAQAAAETFPTLSLEPVAADYDGFPIHALHQESPLAEEIRQDFMERRWAVVLEKGVKYLELNRVNQETSSMLYMMAEARWQISSAQNMSFPRDVKNFYLQALRAYDGGELGAFGQWRLAGIYSRAKDYEAALDCLNKAQATANQSLREPIQSLKLRNLIDLHHDDEALALIDSLSRETTLTTETRLELLLREGGIRLKRKDAPSALAAYEKASALDPDWICQDMEGCLGMARAEMELNKLDQARALIEFVLQNFSERNIEQQIQLTLLHAEILARQNDLKTSEKIFSELLIRLGDSPKGAALQQKMLELHTRAIVQGEEHYCLLLWRQGKVREALAELRRAWEQCLRRGVLPTPLTGCVESILPSFMEAANRSGRPMEAVQAWNYFNYHGKDQAMIRRCRLALADGLEQLGLNQEALKLVRWLTADAPTSGTLTPPRLILQQARLLLKLEEPKKALALLEDLRSTVHDPLLVRDVYEQLAMAEEATGQPLAAAQSWQMLTRLPETDAAPRRQALLRAGEIFLEQAMPLQTIELGLQGLIDERELLEKNAADEQSRKDGGALRLILARAFAARGDDARVALILQDYLLCSGTPPRDQIQARLMLGESLCRLGRREEAKQAYQTAAVDVAAPEPWRTTARQQLAIMEWNSDHPRWKVDE